MLQSLLEANHSLLQLVVMPTDDEAGLELHGAFVVRLDLEDESTGYDVFVGCHVLL